MNCIFCHSLLTQESGLVLLYCESCNVNYLARRDQTIYWISFRYDNIKVNILVDKIKTIIKINREIFISINQLYWIFPCTVHSWANKYLKLKAFS